MRSGLTTAALAGALLLTSLGPARANPLDAFGWGARAIGLGGAYTALVDDFSANYYNPAALAAGDDLRLEFGYIFVEPTLKLNGADLGVDNSNGFQGGIVLRGKLFGQSIGASVGLHMPDRMISRIRSLPQRQPRFAVYDNRPQRIVISTSIAIETFKDLYIGAGLTFLANTKGVLDMTGEVSLSDPAKTQLLSDVDVDLASVRYPAVGLLFTPGENWRFGLTWREEFNLRLDISVVVTGDIMLDDPSGRPRTYVEDGSFMLVSGNNNLFSPRQIAMGVAYVGPCWAVAADLTWVQWSRFPSPTATVDIELDLSPAQFDIPPIDDPIPPGFHDIWIPRVGVEYTPVAERVFGLTLRGGYFYEPTPAPDQPGPTNYVDMDKHGFSAGVSLRFSGMEPIFPKPIYLDLAAQLIWMPERRYYKHDPADPIGDYSASGLLASFSLMTKFLF